MKDLQSLSADKIRALAEYQRVIDAGRHAYLRLALQAVAWILFACCGVPPVVGYLRHVLARKAPQEVPLKINSSFDDALGVMMSVPPVKATKPKARKKRPKVKPKPAK